MQHRGLGFRDQGQGLGLGLGFRDQVLGFRAGIRV